MFRNPKPGIRDPEPTLKQDPRTETRDANFTCNLRTESHDILKKGSGALMIGGTLNKTNINKSSLGHKNFGPNEL